MSLTYVLVVNGPVYGRQSSRTAYRFARALIGKGHTLTRVFFYQDGVSNASSLTVPANDEFDLVAAWQSLAHEHGVELETCVAAALRRGQVSEDEASQHGLPSSNMAEGFSQAGLGALSEALLTADRVIQF
ncbi:sulfurtransferase TusD [Grimontia hollisae]|uniref:Sulfurtransferase TusD homolog n=2 Tax=Grimontia hollisae TaxID=673 RepID=D0I3Q0_GRIHO|nr:sulfurtransferase complex subunit TusD [Grimontia hollisae]AMG30367.1 sulfurtransferase TusD [Grimontia hollisae]EEY73678.1 tRNA 5-methylaminomethyl-2-thiouridine synthase TusD [Grimontia hollisae CIP 101886]STO42103.1 Sulfurtransferase TusD [Grimontia hollisae]STO55981.1 Sulfurtransferase TusD [Grimontia hollisae]STQ77698.1 Sulfurtransferase TusD [Grimontia hollisae]